VPPARAVVRSTDGAVDPVAVTEALVRGARSHGAEVRLGEPVTRLRVKDGSVVGLDTSKEFLASRTVVVAAGVDVPMLCAPLGVDLPVAPSPAVLLRFSGPPGLVRTLVTCPEIEIRESSDGRLVVAADYTGAITQEALHRSAEDTLRWLKATFTSAEDVRLLDVSVGIRPVPADGLPIIGPLSHHAGVYVAVMHSAVTLVPVVGRLVAVELIHGFRPKN
jgi:glycine/D-amino acid oxidase-like deaminating enzyme